MKHLILLSLFLLSAGAFAKGFTCERHQGKSVTTIRIENGDYLVMYRWNGSFPTEESFQGKVTSQFIHDSITLYTFHDFINPGNDVEFTHYGVVGDFEDQRFDCSEI